MQQNRFSRFSSRLIFGILVFMTGMAPAAFGQVGINNADPHPSAILDLTATDKGLLIPRINSLERRTMNKDPKPAHGLLVFDTELNMFFFYDGTASKWIALNPWNFGAPEGPTTDPATLKIHTFPAFEGKVGIGTTTPTEKLEVNGNIKASGNLNAASISSPNITTANLTVTGNGTIASANIASATITNATIPTITGNTNVNGNLTATGTITAGKFSGEGTVPVGAIMMWSGTTPPTGWALCDGNNGTPNLKGRFVVGYDPGDPDYNAIHKAGGSKAVSLTEEEMPNHSHSYIDELPTEGDDATGATRTRYKWKGTVSKTTGKTGGIYIPPVTRTYTDRSGNGPCGLPDSDPNCNPNWGQPITEVVTPGYWVAKPHENRPPYYTLAYIIKLPY